MSEISATLYSENFGIFCTRQWNTTHVNMAICLRTFSHKILPINGIVTTKNHSNRLTRKIPMRTQFLEDVSIFCSTTGFSHWLQSLINNFIFYNVTSSLSLRKRCFLLYLIYINHILDIEPIRTSVEIFRLRSRGLSMFIYIM